MSSRPRINVFAFICSNSVVRDNITLVFRIVVRRVTQNQRDRCNVYFFLNNIFLTTFKRLQRIISCTSLCLNPTCHARVRAIFQKNYFCSLGFCLDRNLPRLFASLYETHGFAFLFIFCQNYNPSLSLFCYRSTDWSVASLRSIFF